MWNARAKTNERCRTKERRIAFWLVLHKLFASEFWYDHQKIALFEFINKQIVRITTKSIRFADNLEFFYSSHATKNSKLRISFSSRNNQKVMEFISIFHCLFRWFCLSFAVCVGQFIKCVAKIRITWKCAATNSYRWNDSERILCEWCWCRKFPSENSNNRNRSNTNYR